MNRTSLVLAAALVAGPALAEPVVLHNFSNGYAALQISLLPGELVYVGEFRGERNAGAPNSFLTFCTDLYQSFHWNTTYTDYAVVANGSAHGLTPTQADLIGKLYSAAGPIDSTTKSVAFQLDVWEIVNDANPVDVLGGTFAVTGGGSDAQRVQANRWLADIHAATATSGFDVQRLYSPTRQDFLVVQPRPGDRTTRYQVPEPAGWALAVVALMAQALAARRRPRTSL